MSTTRLRSRAVILTEPRWPRGVARISGVVLLAGATANAILTAVAPQTYADLGPWMGGPEPLQQLWAATMGEHPRVWVPIVGVGYEAAVGLLALSRNRRRRLAGLVGIAAFDVGLLAMGLWLWAVPCLVVLVPVIVGTLRAPRQES
jgi:hypothetical protein